MHTTCTGFPFCITDDPDSGVPLHTAFSEPPAEPRKIVTRPISQSIESQGKVRDNAGEDPKVVGDTKKRSRSALSQLEVNVAMPEGPKRKVSKTCLEKTKDQTNVIDVDSLGTIMDDMVA